jgi:hypothetical protein
MTDSDIIVVREPKPNGAVAPEIVQYLRSNPHEHTVAEIAAAVEADESQVIDILNNYRPNDDGTVERVPDGQGGGWLPEDVAKKYRSETRSAEPRGVDLGFRWPDGELRDVEFDPENQDHRAQMGMTT